MLVFGLFGSISKVKSMYKYTHTSSLVTNWNEWLCNPCDFLAFC